MVAGPSDYAWSSYGAHVGERADPLLAPHSAYLTFGPDAAARASVYRALLGTHCPMSLLQKSAAICNSTLTRFFDPVF